MCGAFERKEIWFLRIGKKKKIIYTHETAIRMVKFTTESLKIKIYMIDF